MQHDSESPPQWFCLRWNDFQSNRTNVFDLLLQNESFVDVTLACDGHSLKAHKMVLSACSPYFQTLFCDNPCQHPIVIMRDIKWPELKAAVEFMYKGEINVLQEQVAPLLNVAELLQIRGLRGLESSASPVNVNTTTVVKQSPISVSSGFEWEPPDTPGSRDEQQAGQNRLRLKKRRRSSGERSNISSPVESAVIDIPEQPVFVEMSPLPAASTSGMSADPLSLNLSTLPPQPQISHDPDELDIKPDIEEITIQEKSGRPSRMTEGSYATMCESDNDVIDEGIVKRRKKMAKNWVAEQTFLDKESAEGAIKSEGTWGFQTRYHDSLGNLFVGYRCNKVKFRGPQCAAGVRLMYAAGGAEIYLQRSEYEHDHDLIATRRIEQFTEEVKQKIDEILGKNPYMKPRQLKRILILKGFKLPKSQSQFNNYLSTVRLKKLSITI